MTSRQRIALVFCLLVNAPSDGWAADAQSLGKAIYHGGGADLSPPLGVVVNGTPLARAQKAFSCASCHGTQGQGGREAGIAAPPIDWRTLASPRPVSRRGRSREAYDVHRVVRAIRSGIDANGTPLGPAMPRYDLGDEQAASLIAYLQVLGTAADSDPGVTPDEVRIGTVLPISGPLAEIGTSVAASLQARFAEANAAGGIYGRRLTLVVADSQSEQASSASKLSSLIEERSIFAIVGPMLGPEDPALNERLAAENVPVIGPISPPPTQNSAGNRGSWHLQPTFYDQARVLVAEAYAVRPASFRAALIIMDGEQARDSAAGAQWQLEALSAPMAEIVGDTDMISTPDLADRIQRAGITSLFVFGTTGQVEQAAEAIASQPEQTRPLLGFLAALSPAPQLPPSAVAMFAGSVVPPDERQTKVLAASLEGVHLSVERPALQALAHAGASVLVEAMTRVGRRLGRAGLIEELGMLHQLDTGVMSTLDFGSNRRVGSHRSVVIRVGDWSASVSGGIIRSPQD